MYEVIKILEEAENKIQNHLFDLYALDNPEGDNEPIMRDVSKVQADLREIIRKVDNRLY